MSKDETRRLAESLGLVNAGKRESQDICFVPDGDYSRVIRLHTGKDYPTGSFIDKTGRVLGQHRGIINYTIGQRKGLGLALPEPMYVLSKNLSDNTVTLVKNEELYSKELTARDFNWIAYAKPPERLRIKAKVRYRQPEQWAEAYPQEDGTVRLIFDEPQRAIAKGQAVVLYEGDIVVGGGTIS
jgi:tRNA-specific 2-thiouridylase